MKDIYRYNIYDKFNKTTIKTGTNFLRLLLLPTSMVLVNIVPRITILKRRRRFKITDVSRSRYFRSHNTNSCKIKIYIYSIYRTSQRNGLGIRDLSICVTWKSFLRVVYFVLFLMIPHLFLYLVDCLHTITIIYKF